MSNPSRVVRIGAQPQGGREHCLDGAIFKCERADGSEVTLHTVGACTEYAKCGGGSCIGRCIGDTIGIGRTERGAKRSWHEVPNVGAQGRVHEQVTWYGEHDVWENAKEHVFTAITYYGNQKNHQSPSLFAPKCIHPDPEAAWSPSHTTCQAHGSKSACTESDPTVASSDGCWWDECRAELASLVVWGFADDGAGEAVLVAGWGTFLAHFAGNVGVTWRILL